MVFAVGRCVSLTSLLLVLSAMSTLVRSQAPGDAKDQSCSKPPVPDGVFRLLDAGWYSTLLTGGSNAAGWTQTASGAWEGKGSFCTRRLEKNSCGVSDAWVVTQYINKSAAVDYAMNISVAVKGDSSDSGDIKVHYFPSDGPITSNAQLNTANYEYIKTLSYSPSLEEKFVHFSLGSQYDRFYIAIEADNACFKLRGLKVSYNVCHSDPEGLVVYPNTPVGTSAATDSAMCKDNAIVSSGSSLSITCNPDGTFSGSPSCSCGGGHFESGQSCHPCAANFFAIAGVGSCTECPSNTHSQAGASECDCDADFYRADFHDCPPCPDNSYSSAGSTECTCEANYYRTDSEGPSDSCTTGPNKPIGLRSTSYTDTSISLTWIAPPSNAGGPGDIFYIIHYKAVVGCEFVTYTTSSKITNTSATISGLSPMTTYTFVVIAGNKVTEEFSKAFPLSDASRTSDEATITTKPSFKMVGPVMVWRASNNYGGGILSYDIMVRSKAGPSVLIEKKAEDFHHLLSREDFPADLGGANTVTVQLRAVTAQGVGEWSTEMSVPVTVLAISDLISSMKDPEPRISFINNSPVVNGRNVTMHLATNYNVTSLKCRLIVPNKLQKEELEDFQDCSSEIITYTNLPSATYMFEAVAYLLDGSQIKVEREFRPDNMAECNVHLINDGITVSGSSAIIEFASTGVFSKCKLAHEDFKDCTSPYQLDGLSSGSYFFKITPQGCSKESRYPLKLLIEVP